MPFVDSMQDMQPSTVLERRQRPSKRKNATRLNIELQCSNKEPATPTLLLSSRSSKRQLSERSLLELQQCNAEASAIQPDDHAQAMMDKQHLPSTLAPMPHAEEQGCTSTRNVPRRNVEFCDMRERVPASPSDKQSRIMDLRKATLLRAMQHKQDASRSPLAATSVPSPSQQLDPICCSAAVGLGLCAMECASDCESEVSEMRDDYMFAMSDDEVGSVYVVGPRRERQCTAMAVAV